MWKQCPLLDVGADGCELTPPHGLRGCLRPPPAYQARRQGFGHGRENLASRRRPLPPGPGTPATMPTRNKTTSSDGACRMDQCHIGVPVTHTWTVKLHGGEKAEGKGSGVFRGGEEFRVVTMAWVCEDRAPASCNGSESDPRAATMPMPPFLASAGGMEMMAAAKRSAEILNEHGMITIICLRMS